MLLSQQDHIHKVNERLSGCLRGSGVKHSIEGLLKTAALQHCLGIRGHQPCRQTCAGSILKLMARGLPESSGELTSRSLPS